MWSFQWLASHKSTVIRSYKTVCVSDEFKGHQLLEASRACDATKLKKHITPEIINFQHPVTMESALVGKELHCVFRVLARPKWQGTLPCSFCSHLVVSHLHPVVLAPVLLFPTHPVVLVPALSFPTSSLWFSCLNN